MSAGTGIVKRQETTLAEPIEWTPERVQLLKNTFAKGASDDELQLAIQISQHTGLNPFFRELWFIRVWDPKLKREVMQITTGIEGLRLIASRTGQYEGIEGPFYKARGEKEWRDSWDEEGPPYACKVIVHRKGRLPATGIVHYDEFVRRGREGAPIGNWASMPRHMMSVAAERHAIRKAFPEKAPGSLNVVYDEETGQARSAPIRDPDEKASNGQIGELFRLARALGWNDQTRHANAGVASFTELTRGHAHELIDRWIELLDDATPRSWKAGEDDPNVVDAELVEDVGTPATEDGQTGTDAAREQAETSSDAPTGPAGVPANRSKQEQKAAQDDEDFTIVNGPHRGKTIEQVGAVDPDWLRKALEFPALPDKIRNEMKRVLAAREDVGAEEPTAEGSATGADQPESTAPTNVEDVGAGGLGVLADPPSASAPTAQSESVEAEPEGRTPPEAPSAGSDIDGEGTIEPHVFATEHGAPDEDDGPCVVCGYAKEFGAHTFRGGPGDTHETGQATERAGGPPAGEPEPSVGPEDPSTNTAPEPAPETSDEEPSGQASPPGVGPAADTPGEPQSSSDDLADPVWNGAGATKGLRFSELAVAAEGSELAPEDPPEGKLLPDAAGKGKKRAAS